MWNSQDTASFLFSCALQSHHKATKETAEILLDIAGSCTKVCVFLPTTNIALDESL